MGFKKPYIVFLVLMVLGLSVFYMIQLGYYPVAIVGSSVISEHSYRESLLSAEHYYAQLEKKYVSGETPERIPENIAELRRLMLDQMIENVLIETELQEELGSSVSDLVEKKFEPLDVSSREFREGVTALYGMSVERFRDLILEPRARAEILEEHVIAEDSQFSDWSSESRKDARVFVFARDLMWDGEREVFREM